MVFLFISHKLELVKIIKDFTFSHTRPRDKRNSYQTEKFLMTSYKCFESPYAFLSWSSL